MSCTSEVLPEPVAPSTPTVEPGAKCRLTCESTFFSAVGEYLKLTSRKATSPVSTRAMPCAGLSIAGFSRSTSLTRWMLVTARARRRKTFEIIIREFMMSRT